MRFGLAVLAVLIGACASPPGPVATSAPASAPTEPVPPPQPQTPATAATPSEPAPPAPVAATHTPADISALGLSDEAETIHRCFMALAETWGQPLGHDADASDPRFPGESWVLDDGAGRHVRWMLGRSASHTVATVTASDGHVLRLTMYTFSLTPPDFVARQRTRIEIERGEGERPVAVRLEPPASNEWPIIEELATDASACMRRLAAHGRDELERIRGLPAESCGIADNFSGEPRRICRPDPAGHAHRVAEAETVRRLLTDDGAALCAAIGSLREVLACSPPALLGTATP